MFYWVHSHLHVEAFIEDDWAGSLSDRRSSADAKYRAIAHMSCELLWLKHLSEELMFEVQLPISMYCDNQVAIHFASNPVFYEMTKHIEVDCHIIRKRVEKGAIATLFVSTGAQLADMFTKPMFKSQLELLCNKLGLCDIYSPS